MFTAKTEEEALEFSKRIWQDMEKILLPEDSRTIGEIIDGVIKFECDYITAADLIGIKFLALATVHLVAGAEGDGEGDLGKDLAEECQLICQNLANFAGKLMKEGRRKYNK